MAPGSAVDQVIVPRSKMLTGDHPESAGTLVMAVCDFVDRMTIRGFYNRSELPVLAVQAYRADCYRWNVDHGGHEFIIDCARRGQRLDWLDILAALTAMGAEAHLAVARRMPDILARFAAAQAAPQTERSTIQQLNREFFAAEKVTPMRVLSARWIAGWPELMIVDDGDYEQAMQKLATMNPLHEVGLAWESVQKLELEMLDRDQVALGLACTNAPTKGIEVKLLAGVRWTVEIDGKLQVVNHVRTNKGLRYGLVTETHAALYERIEEPPFRKEEQLLECLNQGRFPHPHDAIVGPRLSYVPSDTIAKVIELTRSYHAPTAVDMLLRRIGMLSKELFIFPMSFKPDPTGGIVRWGAADKSKVVMIHLGPSGADMFSYPHRGIISTVSMQEIGKRVQDIEVLKTKLEHDSALLSN